MSYSSTFREDQRSECAREELRTKPDSLELARERSERLSALKRDAERLLKDYERTCVEAYPGGRLEAALALNASVSKVRPGSRAPCGLCS
jgi:hypothetical protein